MAEANKKSERLCTFYTINNQRTMEGVRIIHQCVLCTANYSKIKIFVLMRTSKILCSIIKNHGRKIFNTSHIGTVRYICQKKSTEFH